MMKKALTLVLGLLLLSAFAGTLYYLYSKSEEAPVIHQTEKPFVATIVKKTVATGSVVPRKEVAIKPQVTGIIEKLYVEPGDRVKQGDLIAKVRITPDMVNLNNAQNRLARARLNLENARLDLDRNRRLRDEGIVPAAVLQQFQLAFDTAQEEVEGATDNLQLIQEGTSRKSGKTTNTLVRSTISGTVLEVPLEEGSSVIESNTFNEGTTIATIADMTELIFEGRVDESEVGKIRPGMDLLLTIGALETERYEATLERIAPKGVEQNGAVQFEIRAAMKVQNDAAVRANLSANADIVLDKRENVLAINEGWLTFEGDDTFVEVETTPQVFEKRKIETGLSDGIAVEVVSGLTAEDRVKVPTAAPPPNAGA